MPLNSPEAAPVPALVREGGTDFARAVSYYNRSDLARKARRLCAAEARRLGEGYPRTYTWAIRISDNHTALVVSWHDPSGGDRWTSEVL